MSAWRVGEGKSGDSFRREVLSDREARVDLKSRYTSWDIHVRLNTESPFLAFSPLFSGFCMFPATFQRLSSRDVKQYHIPC